MVLLNIAKMVYPAEIDPAQKNIKTFLALAEYVDEIHLIVQSPDRKSRYLNHGPVHVYLLGQTGLRPLDHVAFIWRAVRLGRKIIRRRGVSVIDGSEPIAGGVAASILARLTRTPAVIEVQGELLALSAKDFSRLRVWRTRAVTRLIMARAKGVRCVSREIRRQAMMAGVDESKLVVVPSRCDTRQFDPSLFEDRGRDLRRSLGWDNNLVAVFVGRLVAHKAVDDILSAWPEISRRAPQARLLVVGDGPLESDLRGQCRDLGLESAVHFYGRARFEEVPALLAAGDVFLSPSLDEGMPRTLLEAMSMGLPSVVTDVGGNPEVVHPGVTGLLIKPRRPDQVAEAMISLLADDTKRRDMGLAARGRVIERFDFDVGIEAFYRFLAGAVGEPEGT